MRNTIIFTILLTSGCVSSTQPIHISGDDNDRHSVGVVHEITNPDRYVETEWGEAVLR